MKKVLAILFVILVATGCGSKKNTNTDATTKALPKEYTLELEANPSTGYDWLVELSQAGIVEYTEDYKSNSADNLVGAGGVKIFKFKGLSKGSVDVTMSYGRSWEDDVAITKKFTISVDDNLGLAIGNIVTEEFEIPTDAVKFKKEYESKNDTDNGYGQKIRAVEIPEVNPMKYSSLREVFKKSLNGDTFVVYFGFSTCPWCRAMISTFVNTAIDMGINEIYYVDVKEVRDVLEVLENGEISVAKQGDEYYPELLEKFANVLSDYNLEDANGNKVDAGEKRIYAPNVVVIKNGEAIAMSEIVCESLEDPYAELSETQYKNMEETTRELLGCLTSDKDVCTVKEKC